MEITKSFHHTISKFLTTRFRIIWYYSIMVKFRSLHGNPCNFRDSFITRKYFIIISFKVYKAYLAVSWFLITFRNSSQAIDKESWDNLHSMGLRDRINYSFLGGSAFLKSTGRNNLAIKTISFSTGFVTSVSFVWIVGLFKTGSYTKTAKKYQLEYTLILSATWL